MASTYIDRRLRAEFEDGQAITAAALNDIKKDIYLNRLLLLEVAQRLGVEGVDNLVEDLERRVAVAERLSGGEPNIG